jgi:hypothetical protein
MNLTTAQIKDILENPEDVSPKCLSIIIADMAERISHLECSYNLLSIKYDQLKRYTQKNHLNSMYGLMVTESLKGEQPQC